MYCSSHLFPIHIIYELIFPNIRDPDNSNYTVPRLMPTVTHSCDEEEWPQNSSQNLHKYTWCTTLSYNHGYFCSFCIIYTLIFPNIRDPDLRYKWVGKSLTCNKHVGFKALCNKQVGFKALVISKSFSSFKTLRHIILWLKRLSLKFKA
jgi:hypothetical protein